MSLDDVWYADTPSARTARAALAPLSLAFGGIVAVRNWLYDTGIARTVPSPLPSISVGNLSVGGTGKTPVAASLVGRLLARGRRPALVMRGYGADEPAVHAALNPDVRVYADPDRAAAIARAARDGADVVVLDDAFQHRRAGRAVDVVLVSAERWRARPWLLPAGPLREPLRALRRATLVLVTHRVAAPDTVARVVDAVRRAAPGTPVAALPLVIGPLRHVHGGVPDTPLAALAGASVLGVAGIGDPDSFFGQLARAGARVTPRAFRDHHHFTPGDVADIVAAASGHKYIASTLKDAVKLGPLWPAKAPPLWYVSQAVDVRGAESLMATAIDTALDTAVMNAFHI